MPSLECTSWRNKGKVLTINTHRISTKIKSAQNLLKFGTFNISNMLISILMPKKVLMKYLPTVRPSLKIKNIQNLSKFCRFDISNISIFILMTKIIFIKY